VDDKITYNTTGYEIGLGIDKHFVIHLTFHIIKYNDISRSGRNGETETKFGRAVGQIGPAIRRFGRMQVRQINSMKG
jgi:hypothetical protein